MYRGYKLSYPFRRLFIGVITPFITGMAGAKPCRGIKSMMARQFGLNLLKENASDVIVKKGNFP